MRRFFLYLASVLSLVFGANMAKADTVFTWDISGTYTLSTCTTVGGCPPGTPTITPGQTWSGSLAIDTTLGLGDPPPGTLTFNNLLPPGQDFGSIQGTCDSTANCTPLTPTLGGWQDWTTVPVGTTFELQMCLAGSGHPCATWIILDVAANGGDNSLVGFTGGTVLAGTEFGGYCANGGIPSSPDRVLRERHRKWHPTASQLAALGDRFCSSVGYLPETERNARWIIGSGCRLAR